MLLTFSPDADRVLLIPFLVVAIALAATYLVATRPRSSRDPFARAGEHDERDRADAARRAQGKAAWMRIGGGGI